MKLLIGIIIALVIAGIGFSVLNKQTATPQNAAQQNQGLTQTVAQPTNNPTGSVQNQTVANISLTNQGFEPSTITIKTGTKVVWTNKSSDAATVNSDPHPIHNLFPFLNLGRFEPGSQLDVIFSDKGKFTYHNHLNPSDKGTVIVE